MNAKLFFALQLKFDAVHGNSFFRFRKMEIGTLYWNCDVIQLNFLSLVVYFLLWLHSFADSLSFTLNLNLFSDFVAHFNIFIQLLCCSVIFLYLFLFFIFFHLRLFSVYISCCFFFFSCSRICFSMSDSFMLLI